MGTSVPGIGEVSVKVILKKKENGIFEQKNELVVLNEYVRQIDRVETLDCTRIFILMFGRHPIVCQFEDFSFE